MSRPGMRLRSFAQRFCDPTTMARLIDPVIADLQCEHAEAVRHGRRWRSRGVRIASGIAFCKVLALAVFAAERHGTRAIAVALSAATLVTAVAICSVLAGTPATIHTRGKMMWLVLYLVPQALAISVPVCLALGLFIWIRREGADLSTKRTVLWLMRLALLLAVANTGWITPAANTAYRNVVAGAATLRGPNELTFIELGQRMYNGSPGITLDGPLPMAFWLNARLSLAIAPVLLCVLALAGATTQRRRSGAVIVFATLAVFVGCYLLVPDDEIAILMRWLPAAAVAWIPDVIVALATVQSRALNWRLP
jgi:hypothetical protein